jgi:tetratricopeptide (TPR) repeat protein
VTGEERQRSAREATATRALLLVVALLVGKRLVYHLAYLVYDPFALATFSDGQLYEDAARDILAHPPLGHDPFYLQGLYAYLLALPMVIAPQAVMGLLLQLLVAVGALVLFYRAAVAELGRLAGTLSLIVLLAVHEIAFYENKYLSVSLGVSCNVLALWAMSRCRASDRAGAVLMAGAASGLCVLARPNLLLALPFNAVALLVLWRSRRTPAGPRSLLFVTGVLLALAPMALRNQIVTGRAEIFPSHAGAIPFYIGNNPDANGRWNTAGGLISGQVGHEREELAARLGISARSPAELDAALAAALNAKAFAYIGEQPGAWLALEARKLWLTIGNHRIARDYDARGEGELIGGWHALGLPFGIALGLGVLGLLAIGRRARQLRAERARLVALLLVLCGQLLAVLAASLYAFASAQNRVPLYLPLAFAAGPGLLALWSRVRPSSELGAGWQLGPSALVLSAVLCAQAFWPRAPSADRPTSVHYFNLAAIEESLGRDREAIAHYQQAAERNPNQPVFQLRLARALRRDGQMKLALSTLDRLLALPGVPPELIAAAQSERALAQQGSRVAPR